MLLAEEDIWRTSHGTWYQALVSTSSQHATWLHREGTLKLKMWASQVVLLALCPDFLGVEKEKIGK